jgi:hypothetical protein
MNTIDDDGYPTEELLAAIEQWPHTKGYKELMDTIHDAWTYADAGYWQEFGARSPGRTEYELSTAGWSGNESIISAMQANHIFWAICWFSSQRGGHYVFYVPNP